MKSPTKVQRHVAAGRGGIAKNTFSIGLKIVLTAVLLMTVSSAMAGIVFVPAGGQYINPELVPVNIQRLEGEAIRIQSNDLSGEITLEGSDFPPEYDIGTTAKVVLPFEQELLLVVDRDAETVSGLSIIKYSDMATVGFIIATMEVRGTARCLPLNGFECGQLVVNLEMQGAVTDPNDPSKVGKMSMEIIGSLIWDGATVAHWATMSGNSTIGGNGKLIGLMNELGYKLENVWVD